MLIDLYIVSYNRPDYLSCLLNSLDQQNCNGYEIGNIHLFQDGPNPDRRDEDAHKIASCIEFFQRTFPSGHVHAAETNIGINGNYKKLWDDMISSNSAAAIVFEDDLELSPHYLDVMNMLLRRAEENPNVGLVFAVGILGIPYEFQKQRIKALMPMSTAFSIHRWGWGITRDVIKEFYPIKNMYFDVASRFGYADNGDKEREMKCRDDLLEFFNTVGVYQNMYAIQVDAVYDLAALLLNRVNLTTYASYARSTGEVGLHSTEEFFNRLGYKHSVVMDEAPQDFDWYEPEMMLDILSTIRRFHTNIRTNYNSGKYAAPIPYPAINKTNLFECLYKQILGWPITQDNLRAHNIINYSPDNNTEFYDYERFELMSLGHRKKKNYKFPYAI
ncbi:MAG: hypothetical protein HON65_09335 [Rhodospirillales bacterium]|nr:hypothetical protein [Rhodospirillales bacterium]